MSIYIAHRRRKTSNTSEVRCNVRNGTQQQQQQRQQQIYQTSISSRTEHCGRPTRWVLLAS